MALAMIIYLFHPDSLCLGELGTCSIITIGVSLSLWMAALFTVKRDIGNCLDKPKINNEREYVLFIKEH